MMPHPDFLTEVLTLQEDKLRSMKVVVLVGASSMLQIPFFGSKDAELPAFCTQIRKFQAGNKYFLSCRAKIEKTHFNKLLKLREA